MTTFFANVTMFRGSSGTLIQVDGTTITEAQIGTLRYLQRAGLDSNVPGARALVKLGCVDVYGATPAQYRITQLGHDVVRAASTCA